MGIPLGIVAGYYGGLVDEVIMRITDIFLAFPALLLALALAAVLPPSLGSVTLAVSVTWWPWYTRLVRGQAASVAGRPFVEGAKASGVSDLRILLRHVLPNSLTPLVVQVSLDVSARDPHRLRVVVLGTRRTGPDAGVGLDGESGSAVLPGTVVARDVPRVSRS